MADKTVFSQILNQKVTFKKGKVWGYSAVCEDGTIYTPEETRLYTVTGVEVGTEEHLLKKIFNGTVVHVQNQLKDREQTWQK